MLSDTQELRFVVAQVLLLDERGAKKWEDLGEQMQQWYLSKAMGILSTMDKFFEAKGQDLRDDNLRAIERVMETIRTKNQLADLGGQPFTVVKADDLEAVIAGVSNE